MKKLTEKEMAKVSGGEYSTISIEEIDRHKGNHVGKYDGVEGRLYCIEDLPSYQMIGRLVRTYEDEGLYGLSTRKHEVEVIDIHAFSGKGEGYTVGSTVVIDGDGCQLYEYVD